MIEEYSIYRDYQRAIDYQQQHDTNQHTGYMPDADEIDYWIKVFGEEIVNIEPESNEPF